MDLTKLFIFANSPTFQNQSQEYLIMTMMMKDLVKTQIIKHMKHSLLIRVVHGYEPAPDSGALVK